MTINTQFHKKSLARVLCVLCFIHMKDIGRWFLVSRQHTTPYLIRRIWKRSFSKPRGAHTTKKNGGLGEIVPRSFHTKTHRSAFAPSLPHCRQIQLRNSPEGIVLYFVFLHGDTGNLVTLLSHYTVHCWKLVAETRQYFQALTLQLYHVRPGYQHILSSRVQAHKFPAKLLPIQSYYLLALLLYVW